MAAATLVQMAGLLVVLRVGWDWLGVALTRRRKLTLVGDALAQNTQMEVSSRSLRRLGLPSKFLVAFFGVLSIARYEEIVASPVGIAICVALTGYFGLETWAHVTAKELWVSGYRGRTIVIGLAAICYGIAAITSVVP